jgi:hypothetical protein
MNIIFGIDNVKNLDNRYIVLEIVKLDELDLNHQCFCVIDGNEINQKNFLTILHYRSLHDKLIINLKKQNKAISEELAKSLYGQWNGELDSFYEAAINYCK